jgi:hypothetical protein
LADRRFVLEAVPEKLATELVVFGVLDQVVVDRDADDQD